VGLGPELTAQPRALWAIARVQTVELKVVEPKATKEMQSEPPNGGGSSWRDLLFPGERITTMNGSQASNSLYLGRLLKEYKKSSANIVKVIVVSLISAAVASFFFLGAFSAEMSNNVAGKIVLSIVGLLFLLPALLGIYMLIRGRGASLSLYENGLIYRRGAKESTTTWDEIESYIQETACRVTKKDGEVIEFGLNIKDADEVALRIQEETSKRMLPQMKAAILKGASVQFKGLKPADRIPLGKALDNFMRAFSGFSVDAEGITEIDEGNRIAWKDVTEFGVAEEQIGTQNRARNKIDVLFIQDGKTTLRTRLGLLENAHIMLAICDEMVSLKNAEGAGSSQEESEE